MQIVPKRWSKLVVWACGDALVHGNPVVDTLLDLALDEGFQLRVLHIENALISFSGTQWTTR